jgi:hypothetical protein
MTVVKALVVYESMFGNTRRVAEAIGGGLASIGDVTVSRVAETSHAQVIAADLLVVGGPTHAHGMTRPQSRANAVELAGRPGSDLVLEPQPEGPGLREWLADLPRTPGWGAAFDTRTTIAAFLSGRASRAIQARLRRHGRVMVGRRASFLVDGANHLVTGEDERARAWGERLAAEVTARMRAPAG